MELCVVNMFPVNVVELGERHCILNVCLSGHLLLSLPLFCESYINGEFGLLILRESLLVPQKKNNNEIMIIIMK